MTQAKKDKTPVDAVSGEALIYINLTMINILDQKKKKINDCS